METRLAKREEISLLKQMWKDIFNDDDEYIELFFNKKVNENNAYVCAESGKILSMLFCVEETVGEIKSAYICGVGTVEKARGKGYASNLLSFAENELKKQNYVISFLIPASESLFEFYKKSGYFNAFFLTEKEVTYREKISDRVYSVRFDYEKLSKFYNNIACPNKPVRDYDNFRTICDCYKYLRLFDDGYLFYTVEKNTLKILEHTVPDRICGYTASMLEELNLEKGIILSPCGENPEPFGMAKFLNGEIERFKDIKNNYINLMLN